MRIAALLVSLVLVSLLAAVAGCGPSGPATFPVSGTVTFNGEPIPNDHNGYITFVPDDKSIGPVATRILDGKYSLRTQEGKHTVQIKASRFVGPMNQVMGLTPKEQYIPVKYNDQSELQAEIKPIDNNEYNFPLDDKK